MVAILVRMKCTKNSIVIVFLKKTFSGNFSSLDLLLLPFPVKIVRRRRNVGVVVGIVLPAAERFTFSRVVPDDPLNRLGKSVKY